MRILVICVGNKLMYDDGLGIEVYRQLVDSYEFPDNVELREAGCMTLDMISVVGRYDLIISVDAVEGAGVAPGTLLRYLPDDVARRGTPMGSLHELKLADLFDAASLLGLKSEGLCLGMEIENASPSEFFVGLTEAVQNSLPGLVELVLSELLARGCMIRLKATGEPIVRGHHHVLLEEEGL